MCEMGKPIETIDVEPLNLPAPLRKEEKQPEPAVVPFEVPVSETILGGSMAKGAQTNARKDNNRGARAEAGHTLKGAGISGFREARRRTKLSLSNLRLARSTWGLLPSAVVRNLIRLTSSYGLSIAAGDLQLLDGKWYVTHSGLLGIAQRRHCAGIRADLLRDFSDSSLSHWVFKATVYKTCGSKGFVGYGDADPSNVSSMVRGAELRIAETRAVNRALRKAYGIGLCSVEELGAFSSQTRPSTIPSPSNGSHYSNGSGNGQPRLRDQLCLLIRQFNLDSNLVKAYAADFCGTKTLSEASRESIERFISQLSKSAKENRDALVCKLNAYSQHQEVTL